MGKEEKALFVEMMKKAGHDPKAMAECVRQMLLQDKIIKAPGSKDDMDSKAVIDATKDILKSL